MTESTTADTGATPSSTVTCCLATLREQQLTFLQQFLDCFGAEICPDEDGSVRAWDPFVGGMVAQVEQLFAAALAQWSQGQDYALRVRACNELAARREILRVVHQELVCSWDLPLRRYQKCLQLLRRLSTLIADFELPDADRELTIDRLGLSGLQLNVEWSIESTRFALEWSIEQAEKVSGSEDHLTSDALGALMRDVCLPSRGVKLLEMLVRNFRWAVQEAHQREVDELVAFHNAALEPLMEQIRESIGHDSRACEMRDSILQRVTEFASILQPAPAASG